MCFLFQIALQYAIWDRIKLLSKYKDVQVKNLSNFVIYQLLENGLSVSILKIIQFAEIDKKQVKFLRMIFGTVLVHDNEEKCLKMFEKIANVKDLSRFREGLRLFINHFMKKNMTKYVPEDKNDIFLIRVDKVDSILSPRMS